MEFKYTFFAFIPLYVLGSIFLQMEVDKINAEEGLPNAGSESSTQ